MPYLRWVSCQTAAFWRGVVARRYFSQKMMRPGRRSSCSGCLMKAWMRMYVMKKVAVWGAELPSVFTMPLGLSRKAVIWFRKEPVRSVPRKVVMTCAQPMAVGC